MKRLVYAPRAYVFVKDKTNTIHDLSRYVVSGSIERKLDAVSSARFTLRNPNMMFTTHLDDKGNPVYGPFTPMDPVTIWLRRAKDHPVRVFTGFLDEAPFIELFPGTVEFEASCTLKRLQYTYFDSGLPYMTSFLTSYGWIPRGDGIFSPTALNEFKVDDPDLTGTSADNQGTQKRDQESGGVNGSLGQLLYGTMKYIGGWDPDQIIIEALPGDIFSRLSLLAARTVEQSTTSRAAIESFLSKVIGEGSFGTGDVQGSVNLDGIDGTVAEQIYQVGIRMGVPEDSKLMLSAFETGLVESNMNNLNYGDGSSVGWRQETAEAYPGVDRRNVPKSAERYFNEGKAIMAGKNPGKASTGMYQSSWSAGNLAQAIQGSAFPDRYDAKRNDALALLRRTASKLGSSPDSNSSDTKDSTDTSSPDQTTRTSGSTKSDTSGSTKYYSPIKGLKMQMGSVPTSPGGAYGAPRDYGSHAGVDCQAALGTTLYAITDSVCVYAGSWGSEGQLVLLQTKHSVPGYSGKVVMGYGHMSSLSVQKGDDVKGGSVIGKSGAGSNGQPHLHFFVRQDATPANGTMNPMALITAAVNGEQPSGDVSSTGDTSGDTLGGADSSGIMAGATAASFASSLNFPTALNSLASRTLGNERALMNDTPLLPFVQQLANSSLRHFQSMPDGKFYAFYPDYFGEMKHHEPYWEIHDIEILDGKVRLTDDSLMTHSFVVGDTSSELGGTDEAIRMMLTSGIVTIFNAFTATNPEAMPPLDPNASEKQKKEYEKNKEDGKDADLGANNGLGLGVLMQEDEALRFLKRYGARPNVEDMPMIHSPQFELFLAYQKFMLLWSKQFSTPFTFTFMPELYPGGKVGFPEHGLQMYIEGVTHSWDYVGGFTTSASLSAPSIYGKSPNSKLLPENMLRAIIDPAHDESVETAKKVNSALTNLANDLGKEIGDLLN